MPDQVGHDEQLLVDNPVVKLGELAGVPAVGRADEVAGDALKRVDVVSVAVRALLEVRFGALVAAVEAAVAVVVDGTVADVVLVHQVHDAHDGLGVVGRVAVDLDIEDVTGVLVLVVRALDLRLVLGGAVVVDRDVAGVGVVVLVRDAGDDAEGLLVALGELAGETFRRGGEEGEVVLVGLGEAVDLAGHVLDDAEAELLGFLAFAVVLADEGDEAFGEADETDGEGALVDDGFDAVVVVELAAAEPQAAHQQRELLLEGGLLEVEAVVELAGGDVEGPVELLEEDAQALVPVLAGLHGLDAEFDDVDGREGEVAAADGGLRTELVAVDAGAAAHGRHFMDVALRVVGLPGVVLVVARVEVEEVREETAGGYLAGELVEVVVRVLREVADAAFFLPDLDREDGGAAVADAEIGRVEDFADDAAPSAEVSVP